LLLAACLHADAARPLAWSGAAGSTPTGWWQADSPHFTLYTDHPPAVARECADALESEWEALAAVMGGAQPPHPRPVRVIVFEDGIASYLETYEWNDARTAISLGRPNLFLYAAYRRMRSIGFEDVAEWKFKEANEATQLALHGYAWALVTWLINAQNERFGRY